MNLSNLSPEAAYGIATQITTVALQARLAGLNVSISADCVATLTPAADSSPAQTGEAAGVSFAPAAQSDLSGLAARDQRTRAVEAAPEDMASAFEADVVRTVLRLNRPDMPAMAKEMFHCPCAWKFSWGDALSKGPGPLGSKYNTDVVVAALKRIAGAA